MSMSVDGDKLSVLPASVPLRLSLRESMPMFAPVSNIPAAEIGVVRARLQPGLPVAQ